MKRNHKNMVTCTHPVRKKLLGHGMKAVPHLPKGFYSSLGHPMNSPSVNFDPWVEKFQV